MSKIYANEDPVWSEESGIIGVICFPRWWNPMFWLFIVTIPFLDSLFDAFSDQDERGRLYLFFSSLSSNMERISDFFAKYKI